MALFTFDFTFYLTWAESLHFKTITSLVAAIYWLLADVDKVNKHHEVKYVELLLRKQSEHQKQRSHIFLRLKMTLLRPCYQIIIQAPALIKTLDTSFCVCGFQAVRQ